LTPGSTSNIFCCGKFWGSRPTCQRASRRNYRPPQHSISGNRMTQHYLIEYGYVIIFLGTMVEGDATLLSASFLAHRGYFRFVAVVLLAAAATTMANQFFFWISRAHGKALLERKATQDPRYARLESWVCRRGVLLLLLSRFLYGLRTAIPAVCGAVGMPSITFFVTNLAGAVLWSVLVSLAGYLGGNILALLLDDIRRHEWFAALLLLSGGLGVMLWKSHGSDLRRAISALLAPDKLGIESATLLVRTKGKSKGLFVRIANDL